METNHFVRAGGGWLSYEKIYPTAIAFCSIMMAVWIPITITNSYVIHTAETNNILTGKAAISMVKEHDYKAKQLETRINTLSRSDNKGPQGSKGSRGDKGEKGSMGDDGISGNEGRKGYPGSSGPRGNDGEKGDKGESGIPGLKGNNTGDPGPNGAKGQKGEKGDGPPTSSPPMVFNVTGSKGDVLIYQTFCYGTCKDVSVVLRYQGDADLYAKEGSPPRIENSDCTDCLCKARSSGNRDTCVVTTSGVNSFYTAVYAHKDYRNGKLTFDGPNFNFTVIDTDESSYHDGSSETTDEGA